MEQVALDVPDLASRECERAVTTALINLDGVEWATATADPGVVAARFDPAVVGVDALRGAVEAVGFQVPRPASD